MGNHAERHDLPRSCRDALSKKCYRMHKTGQFKKWRHKTRTKDLWNTRHGTQIQTKLDQPPWKNGQYQTPEIRPHRQTPGKKGLQMPQATMATRRCWNRSNDLIHGGGLWWWLLGLLLLWYNIIFAKFEERRCFEIMCILHLQIIAVLWQNVLLLW